MRPPDGAGLFSARCSSWLPLKDQSALLRRAALLGSLLADTHHINELKFPDAVSLFLACLTPHPTGKKQKDGQFFIITPFSPIQRQILAFSSHLGGNGEATRSISCGSVCMKPHLSSSLFFLPLPHIHFVPNCSDITHIRKPFQTFSLCRLLCFVPLV